MKRRVPVRRKWDGLPKRIQQSLSKHFKIGKAKWNRLSRLHQDAKLEGAKFAIQITKPAPLIDRKLFIKRSLEVIGDALLSERSGRILAEYKYAEKKKRIKRAARRNIAYNPDRRLL